MNELEERYRRIKNVLKSSLGLTSPPSAVCIMKDAAYLCEEMGADCLFSPYLRLLLLGGYLSITGQDHRIALKMAESPSDCQEALRHPDPVVRCIALDTLYKLWLKPDQMKAIFEQVLLRERDTDILITALSLIGHAFHGTRDREIGKLLARIVTDPSWGEEYKRKTVYQTLLRVAGRPLEEVIQLSYPYLKASRPLDEVVDHSLLEEFLSA